MDIAPFAVPIVALCIPLLAIALNGWSRVRRNRELHETIRRMVEAGIPVPPELIAQIGLGDASAQKKSWTPETNLRGGLINLGAGTGLMIFFGVFIPNPGLWAVGAIPFFLGVALLVAWWIETRKHPSND